MARKPVTGLETALEACEFFSNPKSNINSCTINEQDMEKYLQLYDDLNTAILENNIDLMRQLIFNSGYDESKVVNFAPDEGKCLLYLACKMGNEDIVKLLISAGAKYRTNDSNKYSILNEAILHGYLNIVDIILAHFPESIWDETIEGWSALHAGCIGANDRIISTILQHQYLPEYYKKWQHAAGTYYLPFDPNKRDTMGQTCLYISCLSGNIAIVEQLLSWRVICQQTVKSDDSTANEILTTQFVCPIAIDQEVGDGNALDNALTLAIEHNHTQIASLLLKHGANPNIVLNTEKASEDRMNVRFPLYEAVIQGCKKKTRMLLLYSAKDYNSQALNVAIEKQDDELISVLLSIQSHVDLERKLVYRGIQHKTNFSYISRLQAKHNYRYNNIFPQHATAIDWNFTRCQLSEIRINWLLDAVKNCNPELKPHASLASFCLDSITRIDISNNSLIELPSEFFAMDNLRYLNAGRNKIERLPSTENCLSAVGRTYDCSAIEELYLQDNRLNDIPAEIFRLPNLVILDISNNKLQQIPYDVWKAPKLRELNVALNLLKDLPTLENEIISNTVDRPLAALNAEFLNNKESKNNFTHQNIWSQSLEIIDGDASYFDFHSASALKSLNLSNNMFTSIPVALPCLADNLQRLNMSYNNLRSMGHVTSYPSKLRQLDLSHNQISSWSSLSAGAATLDSDYLCYGENSKASQKPHVNSDNIAFIKYKVRRHLCRHKKHLLLEYLKTLILADNQLKYIQLTTDISTIIESDDINNPFVSVTKLRLLYPNLSMLDISNNCLKEVPQCIHELCNLSILNISGNVDITELPANMGLLFRLWNLNTKGCSLSGRISEMIESKKFKTMEIIGYLKSIYEDAKPYARMKLMVVGSQKIGKTSILQLLHELYPSHNKQLSNDHWTKRMGTATGPGPGKKGKEYNISTVGVDIGTWMCEEKRAGGGPLFGPVTFRTWDFGGQQEYYATHQYFLSKRSLYIVVWRIDDGKSGLVEVLQWLANIQARAPNSPVIIVGTHYDKVDESISKKEAIGLQKYIKERFIAVGDTEKMGLPKVITSIEISCTTKYNIKELGQIIYETAFSLKAVGSKELMLQQKVPACYLSLEDVVCSISSNLKQKNCDPVLNYDNFKTMVYNELVLQNLKGFRDVGELNQATAFLHENGVLLHYNDTTLREFYFLDPQWLCDMLAQVVTIKEINPFVKNGIMKVNDINHMFKSNANDRKYILSLLNKFEVALTWDFCTLLIPSLLPTDESSSTVTLMLKDPQKVPKSRLTHDDNSMVVSQQARSDICQPITRLLITSYIPSGFWSRLMIRILADNQINEVMQHIYAIPPQHKLDSSHCYWKLWQSGMNLYMRDVLIFRISEIPIAVKCSSYRDPNNRFKLKQDGVWCDIQLYKQRILEMYFPMLGIPLDDATDITIRPNIQWTTKLLSLCVDHVDILLEDWYPTLGTRFMHTSEGNFLVNRIVPCQHCLQSVQLAKSMPDLTKDDEKSSGSDSSSDDASDPKTVNSHILVAAAVNNQTQNLITNYSWTIEECILATYDRKVVQCPRHGEVDVHCLAPDLMFLDLNEINLIDFKSIEQGHLIGRGAFGFVFKSFMKSTHSNETKTVAMKILQPVQTGFKSKESALVAFASALEKWKRDPLQHSSKAYFIARQELTIMLNLKHVNIMSLIGVCTQPLALVLDCAPKGSLDGILQSYRATNNRIGPHCFQLIVLQASKAIEYLHRCRIIYRDLKAENVLVWEFPDPNEFDVPENKVHIKIADYGISRVALPTGTKGFGGTEGFMAPEIMKHNGEEEYTEKVDCFSFGMFLYEVITLRQPFEGLETAKDSILEGSRPLLTLNEVKFPSYCLDLMVLCWDQQPRMRPSASQIVSISCAPEFTHLIDVIMLPYNDHILSTAAVFSGKPTDSATFKLCIGINTSMEMLSACSDSWLRSERLQLPSERVTSRSSSSTRKSLKITAVCNIGMNRTLIGDNSGRIYCFNTKDNAYTFTQALDNTQTSAISTIAYGNDMEIAAAGMTNGRIVIFDLHVLTDMNGDHGDARAKFIIAETFMSSPICSICVHPGAKSASEIWCGSSGGIINIFAYHKKRIEARAPVEHSKKISSDCLVSILTPSADYIFSYVSPGCIIYQWNHAKSGISAQLDCSKLVPCSESLGSISIDKSLSVGRCQITAMCTLKENLYVGTSWGCLIVVECATLTPITVFRPHKEEVQSLHAIPAEHPNAAPMLISLGKGYRSLINRFIDSNQTDESSVSPSTKSNNHLYCIIWKAEHWTPL